MHIIVGLGNPTKQYEGTRHNVGFDVIDQLADRYQIDVSSRKSRAFVGKGRIEGQAVILVKPQTYMNLSGESVRSLVDFYKIEVERECTVIYDDVNLDVGQIRIRERGSAGGHNGIKNIIAQLGTQEFPRVRVGVGKKPKEYNLADYVLGHFPKSERADLEIGYTNSVKAVELIVSGESDKAMNLFNKKMQPERDNESINGTA